MELKTTKKRPAELKGVTPSLKVKSTNSAYTSIDIYRDKGAVWMYFRSPVKVIPNLWVDGSAFIGARMMDVYEMFLGVLRGRKDGRNIDIVDAIDMWNNCGLDSYEVMKLLCIDSSMHKKILREPAYTLNDPLGIERY